MLVKVIDMNFGYGDSQLFEAFNLQIDKSEKVILLGHNGAGKTTLMKILAGLYNVKGVTNNARLTTLNLDVSQLIGEFTCKENIEYYCALNKIKINAKEINNILNNVGLSKYITYKSSELSTGNKQKLILARALCIDAELVLLDEPTSGLDPISKMEIYKIINSMNLDNKTLILTSHDLNETLNLATRIIFLRDATIMLDESKEAIDNILQFKVYETCDLCPSPFVLDSSTETRFLHIQKPVIDIDYSYRALTLLDLYYLLQGGSYDQFISEVNIPR